MCLFIVYVCPSVCVIVAASVCACIHTILTVDDVWIGIIGHIVAKQDVRYYRIL